MFKLGWAVDDEADVGSIFAPSSPTKGFFSFFVSTSRYSVDSFWML